MPLNIKVSMPCFFLCVGVGYCPGHLLLLFFSAVRFNLPWRLSNNFHFSPDLINRWYQRYMSLCHENRCLLNLVSLLLLCSNTHRYTSFCPCFLCIMIKFYSCVMLWGSLVFKGILKMDYGKKFTYYSSRCLIVHINDIRKIVLLKKFYFNPILSKLIDQIFIAFYKLFLWKYFLYSAVYVPISFYILSIFDTCKHQCNPHILLKT